jgi:hypothetical protein
MKFCFFQKQKAPPPEEYIATKWAIGRWMDKGPPKFTISFTTTSKSGEENSFQYTEDLDGKISWKWSGRSSSKVTFVLKEDGKQT